jgi:2-oxo-3-hexenedioate decarboxylase
MTSGSAASDAERDALAAATAAELAQAIAAGDLIPPLTTRHPTFDLATAWRVRQGLDAERRRRGAKPLGRKIGFTNRSIWPLYNVAAPMWAHVWSDSVIVAEDGTAMVSLAGLVQPRIEPELALRLAHAPPAGGEDPERLLASCDAYCHTIEIVQSHFPDWRFGLADAAADAACHGRLVVGPWRRIDPARCVQIAAALAAGEVTLRRDGVAVETGRGANALGHPALALGVYLVDALAHEPGAPPLAAGEIVSTGTLTDAYPVAAGETWTTTWSALDLAGLTVRLTA